MYIIVYDIVCVWGGGGGGLHLWLPEEKYHGEQGQEWELATLLAHGPMQTCQTNSSLEYVIEIGETDSEIQGNVTWG